MNGKNGSSIEINIASITKTKIPGTTKRSGDVKVSSKGWVSTLWDFCKEDRNRVIFSLKVGLAVLLVSLLILARAPYKEFGTSIIWSILTVAIMFEYTVGATFNRGLNRALGSLLAGILAIVITQIALSSGTIVEPYIIGISIFLIGAVTSFMKLWPSLAPYEYGFRVVLFTYCLIIVSGYRMGNPIITSIDRLYSIAIGAIVAVLVNVLIFPIWAGEQLHKELVKSFNSVADSLEECVRKYLGDDGSNYPDFFKSVIDEFPDEPAYRKCRSTMNSSATLESLAVSAKWEPPHGRFRHFFYPWSEYVKVGAVLRYCAYEVMALHGVLHSEIQAPYNLRLAFQTEIQEATDQAAELVRCLGKNINDMTRSLNTDLIKGVHSSTERLQHAIDLHSYLLASSNDAPDTSAKLLPKQLSRSFTPTLSELSEQLAELDAEVPELTLSLAGQDTPVMIPVTPNVESYHDMMRKQSRRLHSWPSREVDAFEEVGRLEANTKMKALESTTTLSLGTFTSLIIEFVARLDHLVEAVDELSKIAKFKDEIL
ncbi:aluminum-activated malate transporter 9-like [Heracleum sosnowskyi]|uniref:Aluminum-activated malate transporter 9-like n=1 Tax=Heracleum sosnowskyi TaxID=360622 RepID=A0AAD8I3Z0_9APIA|nr:aluminum-activated malate transporter 9-like [Heracleum sosnowskyi]